MDIDSRLREAGQRWRESQAPALLPPRLDSSRSNAPRLPWSKMLAPLAAAAAVAGIVFGIVSLGRATTGKQQAPPGSSNTSSPRVSNTGTAPPSPTVVCTGSQLRPSLGRSGAAAGAGHVQILLLNVSPRGCHLGGVFPLHGVTASGTTTRLSLPGASATAYPSPVVPGTVAPGSSGAFWVNTALNCGRSGARFATLVIDLSPSQRVQMAWPKEMTNGCLDSQSAAGPLTKQ